MPYHVANNPARRPSPTTALETPKRVALACTFSKGLPLPLAGPACVAWAVGVDEEAPWACVGSTAVGAAVGAVDVEVVVVVGSFFSVLVSTLPVEKVSGPMMIGTTSCMVCPSLSVVVCVNVLVVVSCSSFPPRRVVVVVAEYPTFRVVVGAAVVVAVAHSCALSMMDSGIAFPEPAQNTCRGARRPSSRTHPSESQFDLAHSSEFWRYDAVELASHMPVLSVSARYVFDGAALTLLRIASVTIQAVSPAVV